MYLGKSTCLVWNDGYHGIGTFLFEIEVHANVLEFGGSYYTHYKVMP